jgi:hypothetical protein
MSIVLLGLLKVSYPEKLRWRRSHSGHRLALCVVRISRSGQSSQSSPAFDGAISSDGRGSPSSSETKWHAVGKSLAINRT